MRPLPRRDVRCERGRNCRRAKRCGKWKEERSWQGGRKKFKAPDGVAGLICGYECRDGKTGKPDDFAAFRFGIGKRQDGDRRAEGGGDSEVGKKVPNAEMVGHADGLETVVAACGAQAKYPVCQCGCRKGTGKGAVKWELSDGKKDGLGRRYAQQRGWKTFGKTKGFGGGERGGKVRREEPRDVVDRLDGVVFSGLKETCLSRLQESAERIEETEGLEMGREILRLQPA